MSIVSVKFGVQVQFPADFRCSCILGAMIVFLIFTSCILFVLRVLRKWQLHCKKHSMPTIPGPKPLPVIGNLLEFGFDLTNMLNEFIRICSKYNGICKLFMGPNTIVIVVSNPKYVKTIFKNSSDHIEKSNLYHYFKDIAGKGIICTKGSIWHKNRKAIQPAFQYKMLEGFNQVFNKTGNKLVNKFEEILGQEVDITPLVNYSTMEIIYQSILGLDFEENPEENIRFSNNVNNYMDVCMERIFSPIRRNDFLFELTSDYRSQQKRLQEIRTFTAAVADKKRLEIKRQSFDDISGDSDFGIRKKSTLLDILMERFKDDKVLPYGYINEELASMLTAGHHTLTCFISSILYELSKHQDIQEKLFEEISSSIEDVNCISTKDINSMEYMECVIKEGLRLYSPAPFVERVLDYDTEVDGSIIPKGTNINIFIFQLHRSEQVYSKPLTFDPDRFSAANSVGRDPMAFIPFSFGIRNCIGRKYAMIQMKSLLAKIIYNYRMQPLLNDFEPQLFNDGVLKSKNGFPVHLARR